MFAVVVGLAGANRILADAPLPEIPPVPAITGANAAPEAPKPDLPPAAELLPQLFPLSEFAFTDRAPSSPLDSLLSLTTEPVPDPVAATGAPCDCRSPSNCFGWRYPRQGLDIAIGHDGNRSSHASMRPDAKGENRCQSLSACAR